MVSGSLWASCCYVVLRAQVVLGHDDISLLQHSVSPHAEVDMEDMSAAFARIMSDATSKEMIGMAPKAAEMMEGLVPKASLLSFAQTVQEEARSHQGTLMKGWNAFFNRSHGDAHPSPHSLLRNAKVALLETGAMDQMRHMARAAANKSRTLSGGVVPLDSMLVGFRTSFAPWNHVLKMFSFPLIKASFSMFSNFFGPEGNANRLCLSASLAVDSTYHVHDKWEFGGVSVLVGPAKWDNVPGWQFGASGGIDNVKYLDAADFGWSWTLAAEPETVGFHYDVLLIDAEGMHDGQHVSVLQTGSNVQTPTWPQSMTGPSGVPSHGSSWIAHTWCSPDWENTPLVIEPSQRVVAASLKRDAEAADVPEKPLSRVESWDPVTEG